MRRMVSCNGADAPVLLLLLLLLLINLTRLLRPLCALRSDECINLACIPKDEDEDEVFIILLPLVLLLLLLQLLCRPFPVMPSY